MAMKDWFRKIQPVQLYVVLLLTIAFFVIELIVSHITHALTLLMDSYHMLCNIMALAGCLITLKYGEKSPLEDNDLSKTQSVESNVGEELTTKSTTCQDKEKSKSSHNRSNQEKKLRNTFGWARVDVVFTLICCVFLASLSFSIFVEALQTLIHIDHHDEMHHPIWVLCLGAAGLLMNGICYLLIGGYTYHQESFLYITESGDVVLDKVVINQSEPRRRSMLKTINTNISAPRQRQGVWEMTRDISGCVLVIICALVIFFTDKNIAKFVDPIISLFSAGSIMLLSYPYMKESCLILLQTIPDTIDIDSLKAQLLNHFPDIVNVHDFHVWQLTTHKIISTVHIIFQNPKVYTKIRNDLKEFFLEKGISQVTIQPEFFTKNASVDSLSSNKYAPDCLMACLGEVCKDSHCCPNYQQKSTGKLLLEATPPHASIASLESVEILNGGACSGKCNECEIKNDEEVKTNHPSDESKATSPCQIIVDNVQRQNDIVIYTCNDDTQEKRQPTCVQGNSGTDGETNTTADEQHM
nr:zinc homeostasis factor 1 [Leptinotarsa decemlineata]